MKDDDSPNRRIFRVTSGKSAEKGSLCAVKRRGKKGNRRLFRRECQIFSPQRPSVEVAFCLTTLGNVAFHLYWVGWGFQDHRLFWGALLYVLGRASHCRPKVVTMKWRIHPKNAKRERERKRIHLLSQCVSVIAKPETHQRNVEGEKKETDLVVFVSVWRRYL